MRVQQPVRDRNLSLWQSAVRQTLVNRSDLSDDEKKRAEYGVSLHAQTAQANKPLALPTPQPQTEGQSPVGSPSNIAQGSKAAFDAIQAHQDNDSATTPFSLFSMLRDFVMKYSSWDVEGWVQCGWYYTKYYVLAHLPPSYNDWQAHAPADINFGVIDYLLPKNSRVLMIGDWGTHMPDNAALLRQALKKFSPDVIIHLGDVYYSGTVEECTANVLEVLDDIVADVKQKRPAFFAIPGNHDYYSGGSGFYRMIGKVNSGVAGCTQQASYFCLRTEDSKWQFLGMDTGYGDRNPVEQQALTLQVHEGAWHRDKLDTFPGTTILLSHHQLISAKEKLNGGTRPYLNENLYATFKQYFDRIAAWYWGHEHNFILFQNDLKIQSSDQPLKKGRLIGCSAYEETQDDDPYKINNPPAKFLKNMPRLGLSDYKTDLQSFYNHAFAIFDIAPDKITATYYEYPSWGEAKAPASDPPIDKILYQEQLLPMR